MGIEWPDEVDAVLAGDLAAGLAYLTPARGVVITPMAPLGLRDREARNRDRCRRRSGSGRSSSGSAPIRASPSPSMPATTPTTTGRSSSSSRARRRIQPEPDRAWLDSIGPQWEHFLGPTQGRPAAVAGSDVYYYERVAITIAVRRIVVWPTLDCAGEPVVHGEPLPEPPAPQSPPKNGTGPRTDAARLAAEVGGSPTRCSAGPAATGCRWSPRSRRAAAAPTGPS